MATLLIPSFVNAAPFYYDEAISGDIYGPSYYDEGAFTLTADVGLNQIRSQTFYDPNCTETNCVDINDRTNIVIPDNMQIDSYSISYHLEYSDELTFYLYNPYLFRITNPGTSGLEIIGNARPSMLDNPNDKINIGLSGNLGSGTFLTDRASGYSSGVGWVLNQTISMNVSYSQVPVPAAAWLFGSALIGLAGIGRKR